MEEPVLPIKTKEQLNFLFLCSLIKEAIIENKQLKSFEYKLISYEGEIPHVE